MEAQVSKQIELLRTILREKFNIEQIFIFGSQAYGNTGKESDIDLCVMFWQGVYTFNDFFQWEDDEVTSSSRLFNIFI